MQHLTYLSTVVAQKKISIFIFLSAYYKYEKYKKYIDPAKR